PARPAVRTLHPASRTTFGQREESGKEGRYESSHRRRGAPPDDGEYAALAATERVQRRFCAADQCDRMGDEPHAIGPPGGYRGTEGGEPGAGDRAAEPGGADRVSGEAGGGAGGEAAGV